MTLEEIKLQRLHSQHLLQPTDTHTVVTDLCGVQAQFLSHALQGLSIRCTEVDTSGLIKSWTNRGTMHLFSANDLPLFLHRNRDHFLRPVDTMDSDAYIGAARKSYFADLLITAIAEGTDQRDALKTLCKSKGMTDSEAKSLFDPWGGIIRALCEEGKICHKVQETKAYQLCPSFVPTERDVAQQELLRRYFSHFGPATVKDAAYFFGWPQKQVRELMQHLQLESFVMDGRVFYSATSVSSNFDIPRCLFLAGFDQLMLGYEKTDNLFLPRQNLRDIFTFSGIVRPALLIDGTIAGYWKLKDRKLTVTLFHDADRDLIPTTARILWPDIQSIKLE